jgi:hypothetical protein
MASLVKIRLKDVSRIRGSGQSFTRSSSIGHPSPPHEAHHDDGGEDPPAVVVCRSDRNVPEKSSRPLESSCKPLPLSSIELSAPRLWRHLASMLIQL